MEKEAPNWTLSSLADVLGGEVHGPEDLVLSRPVSAGDDDPTGVTFAENDKYLKLVEDSKVGAVIIGPGMTTSKPAIRVPVPRLAFFTLLHLSQRKTELAVGIHPTAVVDPTASIDGDARVGPYAVVGKQVKVGPGAVLHAHVTVGDRSTIGAQTTLHSGVNVYHDVIVGDRCIVHSGTVIGADGFGFVWDGKQRIKVPQVGGVRIGDDVEIGSNTCIDRATAGETVIGNGTKLDNLVQVAHNVRIGEHVVIAGQCGISGSVSIGDRTMFGGGAGTSDHVAITSDVNLGGKSGVDRDILEPGDYFGTPARPAKEALRSFMLLPRLYELWSRVRKIEKRLGADE